MGKGNNYLRKGNVVYIVKKRCKDCIDYQILEGKITRVGRKNVYLNNTPIEKNLIVDVFPTTDRERLEIWENYFKEWKIWSEHLNKISKEIEVDEYRKFKERVKQRIKEWIERNRPPTPPHKQT